MTNHRIQTGSESIGRTNSKQAAPVIDLATDQPVGYFSSEYLNTRARRGLSFFHAGKAWTILHIAESETVFVLPLTHSEAVRRWHESSYSKSTDDTVQEAMNENTFQGLPTPTDNLIVIESSRNFIIIHTPLGKAVNTTLRLAFDAMLTEQDLIQDSYNDEIRILIQTPLRLTRDEVKSIVTDLTQLGPDELERFIKKGLDARFPFVETEHDESVDESKHDETFKGNLTSNLDIQRAKAICKSIVNDEIKISIHFSGHNPTPAAKSIINEYTKIIAADMNWLIQRNKLRLQRTVERQSVSLICLNCLSQQPFTKISKFESKPACPECGSRLLGLAEPSIQIIRNLFAKRKSRKPLNQLEIEMLARTRRTADLVLSYGKRAIMALSVPGIGPQTASKILAQTQTGDSSFFYELLKTKIHYLTTRELWREKRSHTRNRR